MKWTRVLKLATTSNGAPHLPPATYHHHLQHPRPLSTVYTTVENTTLSRQNELRRFPVPRLQETLSKYLISVEPFLKTSEERTRTGKVTEELGRQGQRLQELLENRARAKENWLCDWWLERAYLGYRDSVVVWSSPGLIFPKQRFQSESDQLDYASKLIAGLIDFKMMLDRECLPVEYQGKSPLDMQQYYAQFGACRIPGEVKDTLEFHPNSRHIVVVHNNEFFRIPVIARDGLPISEPLLFGYLNYIVEKSSALGRNPHPAGILTSLKRDDWHGAYKELLLLPGNAASVRQIQTALFVLCLDGDCSGVMPGVNNDQARTMAHAIHGNGSDLDTGNRWFDKIVQVFVCQSGENGMTIEHSTAEALAPMTIANHAIHCTNGGNKFHPESATKCEDLPTHLPITLNDTLQSSIQSAESAIDSLVYDLDVEMLHFKSFGKSFIKSQKFSPDSFIQMALQYAFYRLHETPGAHYESGALRVFKHGRTDIIRSCSKESVAFARKMLDNSASGAERMASMVEAIDAHNRYAKMTCEGAGIDRHLLGLKLIAAENNLEIPKFFSDPAYAASTTHRISSSQVSGKQEMVVGFGPLVMDGYGCCYNIRDHDLLFGLSAMKSCNETSVQKFKSALRDSLLEMHDLAAANRNSAKL